MRAFLVLILMLIFVASCTDNNLTANAVRSFLYEVPEQKSIEVKDETINIGVFTPLSGPYSFIGKDTKKAINLFLRGKEKINHQKLSVTYYDTRCNFEKASNQLEKATKEDNIEYIIGADCYGYQDHYEEKTKNIPSFLLMDVEKENEGDYFSLNSPFIKEIKEVYEKLPKKPKTYSIVFVDTSYGDLYKLGITEVFEGRMLSSYKYRLGENDFSKIINKIKKRDPELVFFVSENNELGSFLVDAFELDFRNQIVTNMPVDLETIEQASIGVEGLIYITEFDMTRNVVKTKDFVQKYMDEYFESPTIYSASGWDSVEILFNHLNSHGNDKTRINEAMKNMMNYNGVTSTLSFQGDKVHRTYFVKQIRNGKSTSIS